MTTRVRINIPGSRPIPPVVMRSPVGEEEAPSSGRERDRPGGGESASAEPEPQPEKPAGGTSSGSGEFTRETSDWFAPRKPPTPPASARPRSVDDDAAEPSGHPPHADDTLTGGTAPAAPGAGAGAHPPSLADFDSPAPAPAPRRPDGPTSGPGKGDMPLPGNPAEGAAASGETEPPLITPGAAAGRPPGHPGPTVGTTPPAGPGASGKSGEPGSPGVPWERGTDPGAPAGGVPSGPSAGDDGRAVSDTLASGVPRVPAAAGAGAPASPFPSAASSSSSLSSASDEDFAAFDDNGPKKRGRSKLALAGAGLVGAVAVLYGAGLLLDHADIPGGTTVLGVDIGGMSQHAAVNKLDNELTAEAEKPFTVVANGQKAKLDPKLAGLTLDPQETVRNAAGRDYNPVTVIGSLFGMSREAEAVIKVDDEKMEAELSTVAMQARKEGDPSDGMVKFAGGKAVAVPGKPHKAIDPGKADEALKQALRERAVTGRNEAVTLPTSMKQPEVKKKDLEAAVNGFGKTAMSGLVTIKAGDASIQFSPEKSIPKFLTMTASGGKLVDTYDLQALKKLYGSTFDGVKVQRGNGTETRVTPEEVVGALRVALRQTDPAKRVQEIPTAPQ